jgi:hypothetical protein
MKKRSERLLIKPKKNEHTVEFNHHLLCYQVKKKTLKTGKTDAATSIQRKKFLGNNLMVTIAAESLLCPLKCGLDIVNNFFLELFQECLSLGNHFASDVGNVLNDP